MSFEAANKAECESELAESFVSLESTMKFSDEILHVLRILYTYANDNTALTEKKLKNIVRKVNELYRVTRSLNETLDDNLALAHSCMLLYSAYYAGQTQIEMIQAEIYNSRCFKLIKNKELDPKFILITLRTHNDFGNICVRQNNPEKAIEILHKAILFYKKYIQEIEKHGDPVDFENIIMNLRQQGSAKLKIAYINILRLLIDVNNIKESPNIHNINTYKHLTLAAYLDLLDITECYAWIMEALQLCNYLLKYNRFAEARNHITTALYVKEVVTNEIFNKTKEKGFTSAEMQCYMKIKGLTVTLNVYWVKYGVKLLRTSTERLLQLEKDEDAEINNINLNYLTIAENPICTELLLFNEIKTGNPFPDEYQPIKVKYISDYNSANKTFTDILSNFCNVMSCKPLQDMSTYMDLILDVTKAYKYMAFYEKDKPSRILLQNRIIDFLFETINKDECKTQRDLLKLLQLHLAISYANLIEAKLEWWTDLEMHPLCMLQRYNSLVSEIKELVVKLYMSFNLYTQTMVSIIWS